MIRPEAGLTPGQRVGLEALPGFDDERLTAAAPYVHELVRDLQRPDG